jgi:glycosyltransferase involved in cell wall biosynthesis
MTAKLKVLYIDGVGPFGGASRSLYEAMSAFPEGSVDRYFVMQRGTALDFYGKLASDVIATRGLTRFDDTRVGHYRGVRWLVPIREALYFPFTVIALLRARRRWPRIDLIHVNEITEIIPGLIAKALFRAPMVVHTRSLLRIASRSRRTRWLHERLRKSVDAVVAIDEGVRATLPADVRVDVIHNSFTATPTGQPDPAYLAQFDGLRPSAFKVGFVGNLHRVKGLPELLEAARIVKAAGEDVQFLIVGGTTTAEGGLYRWLLNKLGLGQDLHSSVPQTVKDYGLEEDVRLLGATTDIQRVYPRMDVIAFPSQSDAPGRPVFEAAFYGVPSIVAVRTPRDDTLAHGETGLAIPEPDPKLLAEAIIYFAHNRSEAKRMGANAKALAERNFRPEVNAATLHALYRRVVEAAPLLRSSP